MFSDNGTVGQEIAIFVRGRDGIDATIRDIQYSIRTLRRETGFTITALLSLALGIGANAAIFSILHALVLQSLPVSNPQRWSSSLETKPFRRPTPCLLNSVISGTFEGVLAFRTTAMGLSRMAKQNRHRRDGFRNVLWGFLASNLRFWNSDLIVRWTARWNAQGQQA